MRKAALALVALAATAVTAALVRGPSPDPATAASHREAPLISLDPTADITDFFMFRSYEPGRDNNVVLIMDVIPGEEPSAGPNYYNFDPAVRYAFGVDNDQDGATDVRIEFKFENEIRGVVKALGLPLSYLGNVAPGGTTLVPPITALDGPGSEGLGLRQRYTVTMTQRAGQGLARTTTLGEGLIAVPSNVGPKTMPNYAALAAQGIHQLSGGVRVFAGQRQDPFYIDLGGVFDTLNLHRSPLLGAAEDADDNVNPGGLDMLAGFNVNSIAVELPASMISGGNTKLGAFASTSRPRITVGGGSGAGGMTQVQRLANPLVNELIIGTVDKDRWNASDPDSEESMVGYYLKPRLAAALQLVFGVPTGCIFPNVPGCQPATPANTDLTLGNFNRTDLVTALLKYAPTDTNLAELLRLDLSVAPTPLASQKRLTVLAGDMAGWPNGRRPRDDVTDVALRVVGGPNYAAARAGDGVNVDDAQLLDRFPFLALPADGRDYVSGGRQTPHRNPPAPAGTTAATSASVVSLGGNVTPKAPTAARAVVVQTRIVATRAGRNLVVRVNGRAPTARVRITLRNGTRTVATIYRTVRTNRAVRVPNLRIPGGVTSVRVTVA